MRGETSARKRLKRHARLGYRREPLPTPLWLSLPGPQQMSDVEE
jgi:hypothetical protein